MSDATEAWEQWRDSLPDERSWSDRDIFKAGFAAGQVAALEDAAAEFQNYAESDHNEAKSKQDDDPDRHYWEGCAEANAGRAKDLRARAAELSKETP